MAGADINVKTVNDRLTHLFYKKASSAIKKTKCKNIEKNVLQRLLKFLYCDMKLTCPNDK